MSVTKPSIPECIIVGKSLFNGKPEKIFYIIYRKDSKKVEERVGRQYKDAMTAAKASHIWIDKIKGRTETNIEHRKKGDELVTLDFVFKEYVAHKQKLRSIKHDISRYKNHIQPILSSRKVKDIKSDDFYKLRVNL